MAMDKRQTKIVEGAGLDEGRVNQEFIDFLNKWSSPVLFGLALIAGGWWYWNYRAEQKIAYRDSALVQLENASLSGNPNPVTLVALADEFGNIPGLAPRALLAAADVRLSAASRGVFPGATVEQDGTVGEDDLLTDEDRLDEFAKADKLYKQAWDLTTADSDMAIHAVGAASGMAAVAESLGDVEAARTAYERVIEIAQREGFAQHEAIATSRYETLEERLSTAPKLFEKDALPEEYADRPLPGEIMLTPEIEGSTEVVGPEAPSEARTDAPSETLPTETPTDTPVPETKTPEAPEADEPKTDEPAGDPEPDPEPEPEPAPEGG